MDKLPSPDQVTTLQEVSLRTIALPAPMHGMRPIAVAVTCITQTLADSTPITHPPLLLGFQQARDLAHKLLEIVDRHELLEARHGLGH
ncbi:hypothetical protein WAE61_02120 [Comamonadaceae bacterium PP-2]